MKINNKLKKNTCLIYCRTATTKQTSNAGTSIPGQENRCRKRASQLHSQIKGVFIDAGYSGMKFNRPGLKRLLDKCKKIKPTYVITSDITRLSRNCLDHYYIKRLLNETETKVAYYNQQYLEDNPLAENMTVAIGEIYSKNLSERIKRGIKARKEKLKNGTKS